jgi:ribonuclease D
MTEPTTTPLIKARRKVVFVDSLDSLNEAVNKIRNYQGEFAIDAERASGFKYGQRAYLIQIARRDGEIFLIDPAAISSVVDTAPFTQLASVLAEAPWILHAATQDLPCLNEIGLKPTKLIDTELGSRIAGLPRVGLGAVVEQFLGLGLAKEHSAVDWSKRPLEPSWLEYAALDVDVLHELADCLLAELDAKQKLDWALQEFNHLLSFKPKPEKVDRWRGTSGLHEVKSQQGLSVARSLWQAREQLAQKLDVAPGRLIPDSSISFAALTLPKSRPELAAAKQFSGRASRSYLDTWWTAIEEGRSSRDLPPLKLPPTGIPNHRNWPSKFPAAHKRLICSRHYLSKLAEDLEIPLENLVSPEFIRQICWIDRETVNRSQLHEELRNLGSREWQIELIADVLVNAISISSTFEPPKSEET